MPIDIVVPDLGESVTEGTVAAWLKQVGDAVAVDEPLVELETDKATVEIGAPKAGVLTEIVVPDGEDVEVGALLGRIDESASAVVSEPVASAAVVAPVSETDPVVPVRSGPDAAVTVADLLDLAGREGSGDGAEVDLGRVGPAARKLVADHGIDPARVPATGREGRITKGDVQDFLAGATAVDAPAPVSAAPREERVRMTRMRRTIAARLKEAQNTAAILTTFNEVDMTAVRAVRGRQRDDFEAKHGVRLGYTSFFSKACVAALQAVPAVNAEIDGNEIVYKHHYDIGMAVSTDAGLVVPVIRDCDTKSFADIERSLAELARRAREGELTTAEMEGGTFSITNGGVFGSLLSTPILNRPQSAILGLHKLQDRPVAVDGQVVVRPMMYLAPSYDHRAIDGREAVTFLVKVREGIENPERLLLDL
jgi:2-oxoglutarate dehydrogenase E2 component (dihydrolipoamide succinyltransferase)